MQLRNSNTDYWPGRIYVSIQILLLIVLLIGTKWRHVTALAYILLTIAAALMFWAIITMRKSRLRVLPQPHEHATLISSGPYRYIRHPMYTSLLLGAAGLLVSYFTWMRLVLLLLLLTILVIKLLLEEKLLLAKFDSYKAYTIKTYRLLPFIF